MRISKSILGSLRTRRNLVHLGNSRIRAAAFSASTETSEVLQLDLEVETGIAVLTMNRPPANSLSLEMCQEISRSIQTAESDHKIQALILSSGLSKIFSAGLDLTELHNPDADRLPMFWRSFQQVYLDLYGSRLATIAAIAGHAPAAGCMLGLCCDYRIMSTGTIGLNESKLGIVAPPWLGQQYIDTIGHRRAELHLSLGSLFSSHEACDIGLVDEVIADDVVRVAKERAAEWVRIPPQARKASKNLTRGRQIQQLLETRDEDTDHFCSFVTQEKVQGSIGLYLKMMSKKKSKK